MTLQLGLAARRLAPHALLAAFALLCIARAPRILIEGRFWAEEATVYFQFAVSRPTLAALLAPHLGYYSLVANAATGLAAAVPLELAPRLTAGLALVVQLVPAAWLVYARRPAGLPDTLAVRALGLALLAFVATSQEVWLNTITSQFHLAVASALVLATPPAGARQNRTALGVLALGGLSGVVSVALVPLFWLRAHVEGCRTRARQAGLLTACALGQLAAVATSPDSARTIAFDPGAFLAATLSKLVLTPLLGLHAATRLVQPMRDRVADGGGTALAWLAVAAGCALAVVLVRRLPEPPRTLTAAALWLWALCFTLSLSADKLGLVSPWENHRYAYAPVVLLALAGLSLATALATPGRRALLALLVWVTLTGASGFAQPGQILRGPSWPREVAHWRNDPTRPLAVWPRGWKLSLPADRAPQRPASMRANGL